MVRPRFLALSLSAALVATSAGGADAGVIDTRPPDIRISYSSTTGPSVTGGTFEADAPFLLSFTFELSGTAGTFQAVVLGTTAGGAPALPILWQSGDIALPAVSTEFVFTPNINLTAGTLYFIGIDLGSLTTATGSTSTRVGFADADPAIPTGTLWSRLSGVGAPDRAVPEFDVASRIVMGVAPAAVPEPGSLAVAGVGGAGLMLRRLGRGRRAAGARA